MPSDVDIANVALRMVGASRITSFTDGTKNANVVNDIYSEVRDDLLEFPWNFAVQRKKLPQSTTAPEFEFDYAYTLPSDWIMTISAHDNDAGIGTLLYREEHVGGQKVIVASHNELWLRYVSRITDPNLMSSGFRKAFEAALARELAIPLANSNTLFANLSAVAAKALAKARSVDAMGSFPERRPLGSWVTARGGWRFGNDCLVD